MNLSSPGIGSGIDVKTIISQLMSVEQQPLVALNADSVALKAQISAYGSLKSAVSSFRDAVQNLGDLSKFKVYSATSSDADVVASTADSTAARGTYNLQINRIAENHRMATGATFADTGTTAIGADGDKMSVNVGGSAFEIAFGGKTLSQIRDAINASTDNPGVTASILKDDTGYHLSLSANETGSNHALSVNYSGADPFNFQTLNSDRDGSGGFTAQDLDASLKLEGQFDITSSSNSLTDAIQGVTLTLKQAGTVTLKVDRDTAAVQQSVSNLAQAYSSLISTMDKMGGDVLKGDKVVLLNLESQLRGTLNARSNTAGSFENVFQIGLSTQKDGTLEVNSTAIGNALASDFDGVANLFADPVNGVAKRLLSLADSFLATGGPLDGRSQGLDNEVRLNEQKIATMQTRLDSIQLRYTQQYNALDQLVANLTQTGNLLTQQLASLPKPTTTSSN
jgi:flagellar hook-associated protein 2